MALGLKLMPSFLLGHFLSYWPCSGPLPGDPETCTRAWGHDVVFARQVLETDDLSSRHKDQVLTVKKIQQIAEGGGGGGGGKRRGTGNVWLA